MLVAHAGVPPPFSFGALTDGWHAEPSVWIPVLATVVLYLIGYRRTRASNTTGRRRPRAWCFVAGLALALVATDGPMDRYSDVNLAAHMAQHLVLLDIVAPLLALGAPLSIARAYAPLRRLLSGRVTALAGNPWPVAALYAAVLLGTHFTAWYELALRDENVHIIEHLAYLVSGFLLWQAVLGVDRTIERRSPAQRIGVLAALMPVMVGIAVVFLVAPNPLYPYYPALPPPWGGEAFALSSQAIAGVIMWVPSLFVTLAAVAYLCVEWFADDEHRRATARALVQRAASDSPAGLATRRP